MTNSQITDHEELLERVKVAIAAFEALPLGDAYDEPHRAARAALDVAAAQAINRVFPMAIEELSAAALADFRFFVKQIPAVDKAGIYLATVHERAMEGGHEQLAAAIRSVRGRSVVYAAAANTVAATFDRNGDVRGDDELSRFSMEICRQLSARELFLPWSRLIANELQPLSEAIDAEYERRNRHANEEAARIAAENEAAARAIAESERARRDACELFFAARGQRPFEVNGRMYSGVGLASVAKRVGARDSDGHFASNVPSLEQLEQLMTATNAYDDAMRSSAPHVA